MINIKLPDESFLSFDGPVDGLSIAKKISENLAKVAVAVKVDGTITDLTTPITHDASVTILTTTSPEALEILRHTTAHVLAHAVTTLFPGAKATIGPAIENGFYYDFYNLNLKEKDLELIENKMHEIINANYPICKTVLTRSEAVKALQNDTDSFKLEILNDLPDDVDTVSLYTENDYVELCRGPHMQSTGLVGSAFKLTKMSAAYWRGDSNRETLQRIYGTAFFSEKELKKYFTLLEEAEKRDHRKIGKALDLWYIDETAPGCPYLLPKGLKMFNILIDFWRDYHENAGYQEFAGPLMNSSALWKQSGHWDHYRDDMYLLQTTEEDANKEIFGLKPMSCPATMILFNQKTRSYQDLPLRLSDVDMIHRNESSGSLSGLFRVRQFHQDDAHIFVTEDQIEDEYLRIFKIVEDFYTIFGLDYEITLSTRPDDFMGDIETWDKAEDALKNVIKKQLGDKPYIINEGDGAFYGPKVDILMKDCLGRKWQMGTIQLDFQLAGRFNCVYADKDGSLKTPVVIHRVIYGSLERFLALITEHFAGLFPVWISPVQVRILPVSDKHVEQAEALLQKFKKAGIRAEVDKTSNTINYQIRQAHNDKIPYAVILGDKEISSNTISIRDRQSTQKNFIDCDEFIKNVQEVISQKKLTLY